MSASIFLEFALPNAATWFYFSFLLGVAVFYRFDRALSLRNWDLITLFLLAPGLLFLIQAHGLPSVDRSTDDITREPSDRERLLLAGYIWLMAGSFYFFVRCIFDLGLEKRPTLAPNLNRPGLVSLGVALFVSLSVVAIRKLPDAPQQVGRDPVAVTKIKDGATIVANGPNRTEDAAVSRPWAERIVAIILHLAVVVGLALIGARHFRDAPTGVGMAALYLMLPYTAYHVSQIHHVWPAAFTVWAVYAYRRPVLSGALLGVAAGTTFFPVLLFPLWFGFYRGGRGSGRFALGFALTAGLGLGITAAILIWSGQLREYLNVALSLSDWQAWKAPKTEGIWLGSRWAYRIPVFIAYMAFIVLTIFWPKPRNLAQVIAQSAAVVIGVQFWYADQGGVYVLWYLPLVILMVFRPNLVEVRPPLTNDADWLSARAKVAIRWVRKLGKTTETASAA